jgi:DNA replication protein DnaC
MQQAFSPDKRPCPHCGRERPRIYAAGRPTPGFEPCDCEGYREAERQRHEAEKRERTRRRAEEIRWHTRDLYDCSGLDSLFTGRRLDQLQTDIWNNKAIGAAWEMVHGKRRGLWLWGRTGRGKTQIAQSAAFELVERGVSVAYLSAASLVADTRPAPDMGRRAAAKRHDRESYALSAEVLMIDDLGKERRTDAFEQALYNFVNAAYQGQRRLILTTNLEPKAIHATYDEAVYRRFVETCGKPIECGGDVWLNGERRERR